MQWLEWATELREGPNIGSYKTLGGLVVGELMDTARSSGEET